MIETVEGICHERQFFLRSEALALGWTDKGLRQALRRGDIVRVRHGAYTLTLFWEPLSEEKRHLVRAAAVVRTAKCSVALSHTSAALALGADVWGLSLDPIHLHRFDHRAGRREAGVVQHRGVLANEQVVDLASGLRCTTASRTVLDVSTITGVQPALVVADSLIHQGLTSKDELESELLAMTHVPGSLTSRLVVGLSDGRRESVGETRTAYALWTQGLPAPIPQVEVHDRLGTMLGRVDFAWPDLKVFVEFDGRAKYTKYLREGENTVDVVLRERDRERAICRATGWICIRFVWSDLRHPQRMASIIRQAFAEAARVA